MGHAAQRPVTARWEWLHQAVGSALALLTPCVLNTSQCQQPQNVLQGYCCFRHLCLNSSLYFKYLLFLRESLQAWVTLTFLIWIHSFFLQIPSFVERFEVHLSKLEYHWKVYPMGSSFLSNGFLCFPFLLKSVIDWLLMNCLVSSFPFDCKVQQSTAYSCEATSGSLDVPQ